MFWVAAVGGIIVFGSLMGALFIGQQFMQNVLGYSTFSAGFAILPAAVFMVLVAAPSARLVHAYGSRFTLLAGAAQAFLDRTGQPWGELEAHERQDNPGQVHAHLGQEQSGPVHAQGMALGSDQVLDLAHGKAHPDLSSGVT